MAGVVSDAGGRSSRTYSAVRRPAGGGTAPRAHRQSPCARHGCQWRYCSGGFAHDFERCGHAMKATMLALAWNGDGEGDVRDGKRGKVGLGVDDLK